MEEKIVGVQSSDIAPVRDATDVVRSATGDLPFDHSRRVYLWGTLQVRRRGLVLDPELLYVSAMFHDPGSAANYGRTDSFEIDGADAAWDYLLDNGSSIQETRTSPTRRLALHCSSLPASRNGTSAQPSPKLPTHPDGKFGHAGAGRRYFKHPKRRYTNLSR